MKWDDILRQYAEDFIKKRAAIERFDYTKHEFYVHDPEMQFLSLAFTGYLTDFFYMKGVDVLAISIPLHNVILSKDPELYMDVIEAARYYGTMKDQVLIGMLILSKNEARKQYYGRMVKLLASFPPNQLYHKFVKVKRKEKILGGLASFDKRLIHDVINQWISDGRFIYYMAKYRKYVKKIIELTHYPLDPELFKYLSRPSKYDGDNEYLKGISLFYRTKDFKYLPQRFPFEILRSYVKKEDWTLDVVLKSDLTGNTLVLMAVSLVDKFGDKILKEFSRILRSRMVTADKVLKAAFAAYDKGYTELATELAMVYAKKVAEAYKDLLLPIETPNIAVVLDASGSMAPTSLRGEFMKALSTVSPLAPLIKYLIVFSDNADYESPELLKTFLGLIQLQKIAEKKYDRGTCIACGLKLALKLAERGEIDTVILVTDEQANILMNTPDEATAMEIIRRLLKKGIKVIVLNPTPYPVHVTDIREKDLIYVPAPNPESLVAALKLIQLKKALKKAGAKKLVKKLVKVAAKTKKAKKEEEEK
ncbi:MAG TPA: VWA domain-containing protein [Thermoprotei archaeon]|nr:VWA domain-containing protein [Thermoprotei archaeon]